MQIQKTQGTSFTGKIKFIKAINSDGSRRLLTAGERKALRPLKDAIKHHFVGEHSITVKGYPLPAINLSVIYGPKDKPATIKKFDKVIQPALDKTTYALAERNRRMPLLLRLLFPFL